MLAIFDKFEITRRGSIQDRYITAPPLEEPWAVEEPSDVQHHRLGPAARYPRLSRITNDIESLLETASLTVQKSLFLC